MAKVSSSFLALVNSHFLFSCCLHAYDVQNLQFNYTCSEHGQNFRLQGTTQINKYS